MQQHSLNDLFQQVLESGVQLKEDSFKHTLYNELGSCLKQKRYDCTLHERLLGIFLLYNCKDIIALLDGYNLIDWASTPIDYRQKASRMFIDNFTINTIDYRSVILHIFQCSSELEDYIITRLCNNCIDLNYFEQFHPQNKEVQFHLQSHIQKVVILKSIENGLQYYLLLFHGDFSKTVEYITNELNIDVLPYLSRHKKQDLLYEKAPTLTNPQSVDIQFCYAKSSKVQTLTRVFKGTYSKLSESRIVIKYENDFCLVIESSNVAYSTLRRKSNSVVIHLYHPPLIYKEYPCGCIIRCTANKLGKCNSIVINFYEKLCKGDMPKLQRIPLAYTFKKYVPCDKDYSKFMKHLFDMGHLKLLTFSQQIDLQNYLEEQTKQKIVLFFRIVHFCHIPLCSQLTHLLELFTEDLNCIKLLKCVPINKQEIVKNYYFNLLTDSGDLDYKSYTFINILTPTKNIHAGFHTLPHCVKNSDLVYVRDEGMNQIDFKVLDRILDETENVYYSFDDLLQGRYWVTQNDNVQEVYNYVHLPLYLNAFTLTELFKNGLQKHTLKSIVEELFQKLINEETNVIFHFLPVSADNILKVREILTEFISEGGNINCALVIKYVKKVLEHRIKNEIIPILNGGTFYFKKCEGKELSSGEISLTLNSYLEEDELNEVMILSPFLQSNSIRKFRNKAISQALNNVIYYSEEDSDYFDAMESIVPKCNCIWDKRILEQVNENCIGAINYIKKEFKGDTCDNFKTRYMKLLSERVDKENKGLLMQNIISKESLSDENCQFMRKINIADTISIPAYNPYVSVEKEKMKDIFGKDYKRYVLLKDIVYYKQFTNQFEISSPWTLQIVGNIENPIKKFQLEDFLQILEKEERNGEKLYKIKFYGVLFILTQEENLKDFMKVMNDDE